MLRATRIDEVLRFDIARAILGRGRYWTTCYLVDSLLIDSGCAHARHELLAALAEHEVERIVNTHAHEDHIGANAVLQQARARLEISAHPLALAVLGDPRGEQPLHPYRKIMWGWPDPCQAHPLEDGELVETEHHRFRVIFTPGHSDDHLCLFEPDRGWLFTGDLFVGGRDRALRQGADVWLIIDSLKRMRDLEAEILFPGSARIRQDPRAAIQAKIDHLESVGERVLDLSGRGWSVGRIVRALCGAPMVIEALTLGHFSRRHLVLSYLGRYSGEDRRDQVGGRQERTASA